MVIKCGICTKEFYGKPSHVARGLSKYCSKNCFDIWQRANKKLGERSQRWNSVKRVCKVCSVEFYRCPAKIALGRGIYCSRKCYSKGMIGLNKGRKMSEEARIKLGKQRIGKLNPAYVDGSSRDFIRYEGQFSNLIKQKIREKYDYTCQSCGNKKIILHVHHIDLNPLNNNEENFTLLCISCHRKVHGKYSNIVF